MTSQRPAFFPTHGEFELRAPCLFEVKHGETVIRIADDWDGHVLVEKLYIALRKARQARDKATLLKKAGLACEDELAKRPAT